MKAFLKLQIILFLLLGCSSIASGQNYLSIPDIQIGQGKSIVIPVELHNTAQISAFQFILQFPEGLPVDKSKMLLSERKGDHILSIQDLGNNRFQFIALSFSNAVFKGNNGSIVDISVTVPVTFTVGKSYPLTLSNVILSNPEAEDVGSGHQNGSISILHAPSPDLMVSQVLINQESVMPEGILSLSWTVKNIGDSIAPGGWSEKIYLASTPSGSDKFQIGTASVTEDLTSSGIQSRNLDIIMPKIIGREGPTYILIEINPTFKELLGRDLNNKAVSETTVDIGKKLYFQFPSASVSESISYQLRCILSRSGNTADKADFTLSADKTDQLNVPATISIPAGQSGVAVYITTINNNILEGDRIVNIQVSGNGYESISSPITILDAQEASLSISATQAQATEGESIAVTISRDLVTDYPLTVKLSSAQPKQWTFPEEVIIGAAQSSVTFNVEITDDDIPEINSSAFLKATADRTKAAILEMLIIDNDVPAIAINIEPASVSEGAGPNATWATVTRVTPGKQEIRIKLSTPEAGQIFFTSEITLKSNEAGKKINIGTIDNNIVDGNREITLTAAVYIASCSCPATDIGKASAKLTILDDDGPTLMANVNKGTLPEGKHAAGTLTVSRNTVVTTDPVTVRLSHNKPLEIELPATAVIPSGSKSVEIPINTLDDGVSDGDQTVTITAEADGFTKGVCWVVVTDQNKPDLEVSEIQIISSHIAALGDIDLSIKVNNTGIQSTPAGIHMKTYLSKDMLFDNSDILLDTHTFSEELIINQPVTVQKTVKMPAVTGSYYIIACINPDKQVHELLDINNTKASETVNISPEYTANISLSGSTFPGETPIQIGGKAEYEAGRPAGNKEVDIYVVTNNFRRELSAISDSEGNFNITFTPLPNEGGHYYAGACYPGQKSNIQQATFDIPSVKRVDTKAITWDILEGHEVSDSIAIINPGSLGLNNLRAEVISAPDNCKIVFEPVSLLTGNEKTHLHCKITGLSVSSVDKYEEVRIRITSDEGAKYEFNAYFYCRWPKGALKSYPSSINTTMTKGSSRMYEFSMMNIGSGETGNITVSLPQTNWMRLVTPAKINSLPATESTTVILELTPSDDIPLNTPISGKIAVNCENGTGLSLPFRIEAVSESTGSLLVDVTDEYTYYTESGAHLENAHVILRHPFSGAIISEGYTDNLGHFSAENIPEGLYTLLVTAEKHESYQNTIVIDPGVVNRNNVFLSFQAITYTWNVVPTEIEDEYDIQIIAEFETNVPAPVIVMEMPEEMPELQPGESYSFMLTITNKGLITGKDLDISFSEDPEYTFSCLYEVIDIMAQQSIQVPVIMTKKETTLRAFSTKPCGGTCNAYVGWECIDFKWVKVSRPFTFHSRNCLTWTPEGNTMGGGGGVPYPAGFGGGGSSSPSVSTPSTSSKEGKYCDPCKESFKKAMLDCVISFIPVVGDVVATASTASVLLDDNASNNDKLYATAMTTAGFVAGNIPGGSEIVATVNCVKVFVDATRACVNAYSAPPLRTSGNSAIDAFGEKIAVADQEYQAMIDFWKEIYGNDVWLESSGLEFKNFWNHLTEMTSKTGIPEGSDLYKYKPSNVPDNAYHAFIKRWNNTLRGIRVADGDTIRTEKLGEALLKIVDSEEAAVEYGYSSVAELHTQEVEIVNESLEEGQQSVCASVTIQFSQTMTMTREAFEGTLTIDNGHETIAMKDIHLDLIIKNENGEICNNLFQINTKALSILTGIDGTGTLNAKTKGSATILFIPTKDAAPEIAQSYSFAGTLSYIDPFKNEKVSKPLAPITLQVNPSPNLYLRYFLQRNVFGDDALTPDIVEPSLPAELAVLIHNKGAGIAKNVKISSAQPEIIDNEKGLSIHFEIIGTSFNGKAKELGITNIDFGNIDPGKTGVGQWWFTSSLLGHFVSYEAKVTHLNSYGNANLSLVEDISVHELIRSITSDDDGVNDFLVNDITDANDTPDAIYFSDGSMTDVSPVLIAETDGNAIAGKLSVQLSVQASKPGWNYGIIDDPGSNRFRLTSVTRNDGKSIPLTNFWQTGCTLLDGKEPVYENKLHFTDNIQSTAGYTLLFEAIDQDPPAVTQFENVPVKLTTTPVQHVVVTFNKEIDPDSFTYEDIVLRCQGGENIADERIEIGKVSGRTSSYLVDISALTKASGYYVMTVQAAGISDLLGNFGTSGKQASWTQMFDFPAIAEVQGIDETLGTPIDTLRLKFNMPVKPETFTAAAFSIERNENSTPVTGITIYPLGEEQMWFKLENLQSLNEPDGNYTLKADLSGVQSAGGKSSQTVQTFDWLVDRTGPALLSWSPDYTGGLDEQHLTGFYVVFNEEIKNLPLEQLQCFANNMQEPISFVSIKKITGDKYFIGGLKDITYIEKNYRMILDLSGVEDTYGNKGTGTSEFSWKVDRSLPAKATNLAISPDLGHSSTDGITSTRSLTVSMDISQADISVEIYEKSVGTEILLKQIYSENPQRLSVPVELKSTGNVTLVAKTIDKRGFSNTSELQVYIDNVPLTASWENLLRSSFCETPEEVKLTFSDAVETTGWNKNALSLTHNGKSMATDNLQINKISGNQYSITGLNVVANASGSYNLCVDLSQLHKYNSGLAGSGKSASIEWSVVSFEKPVVSNRKDTLYSSVSAGNQWYFNGTSIEGATGASYIADQDGLYSVSATNAWGCSSLSDEISVTLTGIPVIGNQNISYSIYPNPTNGIFYITTENSITEKLTVSLSNTMGQTVFVREWNVMETNGKGDFNISMLPKGMYLIRIIGEGFRETGKIILK